MSLVVDAFIGFCDTAGMNRHVTRYPDANPAYRVVSERDNPAWKRPRRRPQNSWLQPAVDACRWESLGMGREPAWRLARRDRQGWRHRVGEATRPGVCTH